MLECVLCRKILKKLHANSVSLSQLSYVPIAQIAIVRISINLCLFLRSILGYSIPKKWSAIVIFGFSFMII